MSITKDLIDVGISEESAKLAEYQFKFLQQMGVDSHIETYQSLVNETVIAARDRILAYYKDKIEFDEDVEFLEQQYIPDILQANLDAITQSFNRNFGGLLSGTQEYQELNISNTEATDFRKMQKQEYVRSVMEEQRKQYLQQENPQEKQGIFSRIKESVTSFFGKSKSQATTAQRGTAQKQTTRKQGFFSRAVSAIKSFFVRG